MASVSTVHAVDDTNVPRVRAFLEDHADTSMFLLGNLKAIGPRLGTALNSGDFKFIEEDGRVRAVFCLTRRTTILAEAGGRTEFAPVIVAACQAEPIPIGGVLGEWKLAEAIWSILQKGSGFKEVYAAKEVLQACDLNQIAPSSATSHVRLLRADDFDQWHQLNLAFCAEEGLPVQGTQAERQAQFGRNTEARLWWGCFEDGCLLSMAGLNAVYEQLGQVGGVYTVPEHRRRGLSRATMNALLTDSVKVHGLKRLILFTGEHNHAAQHLYDTLGFSRIGDFALLMCTPIP